MSTQMNITQTDLDALSGGIKAAPAKENEISVLASFGLLVAHIAYFPAAAIALLNADQEWFGLNLDVAAWAVLLICGAAIALAKVNEWGGRMVNFGRITFLVMTVIMVPFMLGFAALTFLYVALTGPAVLAILWKGVLFFGFQFWYISGK